MRELNKTCGTGIDGWPPQGRNFAKYRLVWGDFPPGQAPRGQEICPRPEIRSWGLRPQPDAHTPAFAFLRACRSTPRFGLRPKRADPPFRPGAGRASDPCLGGSLRDSYPLSMYGGGGGGTFRRDSASGKSEALHYHESRLSNQYSDPSELQRLKV